MAYSPITKPTAGTGVSKLNFGDKAADNDAYFYSLRDVVVWIPLNGATALVAGDKAYYRIPAKLDGGLLVGVAAACKVPSSSGAVELTVKNGATAMLSSNIVLDETETDTTTSSQPGTIDTAHDDLATGDFIEISVVSEGTDVTFCGVELTLRPA